MTSRVVLPEPVEPYVRDDIWERSRRKQPDLVIAAAYDLSEATVTLIADRWDPRRQTWVDCGHCRDDPPRGHACPRCGLLASDLREGADAPCGDELYESSDER